MVRDMVMFKFNFKSWSKVCCGLGFGVRARFGRG